MSQGAIQVAFAAYLAMGVVGPSAIHAMGVPRVPASAYVLAALFWPLVVVALLGVVLGKKAAA